MTAEQILEEPDIDVDPAPEVRRRCKAVILTICLFCGVGFFTWPESNWAQDQESAQQTSTADARPTMSAELPPSALGVQYR